MSSQPEDVTKVLLFNSFSNCLITLISIAADQNVEKGGYLQINMAGKEKNW